MEYISPYKIYLPTNKDFQFFLTEKLAIEADSPSRISNHVHLVFFEGRAEIELNTAMNQALR